MANGDNNPGVWVKLGFALKTSQEGVRKKDVFDERSARIHELFVVVRLAEWARAVAQESLFLLGQGSKKVLLTLKELRNLILSELLTMTHTRTTFVGRIALWAFGL